MFTTTTVTDFDYFIKFFNQFLTKRYFICGMVNTGDTSLSVLKIDHHHILKNLKTPY